MLLLLLFAAHLRTAGAGAAAGRMMTLMEYRAALLQARSLAVAAQRAERLPSVDARAIRARLEAAVPVQAEVRLPSGSTVFVDNRLLTRSLAEPPFEARRPIERTPRRPTGAAAGRRPFRAAIGLGRFVAAVDQLLAATALSPPAFDTARAERALRAVLARPEYQYKQRKPSIVERFFSWLGGLVERFFLWLGQLLDRWLPGASPAPGRADRLAQFMVIGVVLLLAALIARMLLVVLPNLRRLRRAKDEEPAGGELMVPQEPHALLAEAEREAAAGRYREALRLAYLATVARLDRAGVLPEDRSRTHWELLRDLRRAAGDGSRVGDAGTEPPSSSLIPRPSSLVAVLAPLTQRLDERLYGGRTTTADDYQACRAAHDQIERLLCAPA